VAAQKLCNKIKGFTMETVIKSLPLMQEMAYVYCGSHGIYSRLYIPCEACPENKF
jgi:hypothetical protein